MNPVSNPSTVNLLAGSPRRAVLAIGGALALLLLAGCGEGNEADGSSGSAASAPEKLAPAPAPKASSGTPSLPADLELGLVLALSAFPEAKPGDSGPPVPLPAELEFIVRRGGEWVKTSLVDPDSNVFHKAMAYPDAGRRDRAALGSG